MVRTDSTYPYGRLHAYMETQSSGHLDKSPSLTEVRSSVRQRRRPNDCSVNISAHELLDEINSNCHSGLLDVARHCTYIGMVDDVFALVQHNTHLYLANVVNLSKELMYQQVLSRLEHFNAIQLSDPAPLKDLIMLALQEDDLDSESTENDELKIKIAEMNTDLLKQKAGILEYHFCIHIDKHGNLSKLPVILDQYTPDMDRIPEFVLSLGNDVDWDVEKNCLQTIAACLGNFYAMHPPMLPNPTGDGLRFYKKRKSSYAEPNSCNTNGSDEILENDVDHELLSEAKLAWSQREWSIQHVLFPSLKLFFKPPSSLATNGTFVQIASLEKLYRVFERC